MDVKYRQLVSNEKSPLSEGSSMLFDLFLPHFTWKSFSFFTLKAKGILHQSVLYMNLWGTKRGIYNEISKYFIECFLSRSISF